MKQVIMCDLSIAFQPLSQKSSTNCAIEDSFTNTCYNYEKEKNKKISNVIEKIIPELEDKKQEKKEEIINTDSSYCFYNNMFIEWSNRDLLIIIILLQLLLLFLLSIK